MGRFSQAVTKEVKIRFLADGPDRVADHAIRRSSTEVRLHAKPGRR